MQELQNGTTLQGGKYRIEKMLGQGGFGITYHAVQNDNQRQVAIKELFMQGINERSASDSTTVIVSNQTNSMPFSQQRKKFEKEARRLSELDEPHIVKVYDFFEENETAYYVMDYVHGRSLAEVSKTQVVTEQQANDYIEQMLTTLRTLHQHNIWHLDIKPANILVNDQNQLILIDFGASKHIEHGGMMTTSSVLAYTPGFAPPEQIQGNMDKFGPWTDFYALGATIYQILTRQTPPSIADILGEGVGAFAFSQTVSYDMQQRIMWMMRPNYKERPQQVDDFYNYKDPKTVVVNPEKRENSPQTSSKRKSILLGFIILVLLVMLIIITFAIVQKQSSNDVSVVKTEKPTVTNNQSPDISTTNSVSEKNNSETDVISLINHYLSYSKGEDYAIPYDVFFDNKSLKEESDKVEMEDYGNYSFAKKYRAKLTIDGKVLGGIWYLALRGPRAGAFIFEMQSSVGKDGMEYIVDKFSKNKNFVLIKKDTENVSMFSSYFYKVKNGYVYLEFNVGAGQIMVSIMASNMKGELESLLN